MEQTVSTEPKWIFKPSFERKFKVGAPYYSITDDDVLGCFPPPGARGPFGHLLPYVSLRDAQLPWERKLGVTTADEEPWLALLVLAEGELSPDDVHAGPAAELLKDSPTGVIRPKPPSEEIAKDTACTVVDIPVEVFTALLPPQAKDLALLAHAREAVDEPLDGSKESGRPRPACSQVISSRFPGIPQASTDKSCHYTAHVVSLAGHQESLISLSVSDPIKKLGPGNKIRLISLYSWSFSSLSAGEAGYYQVFDAMQKEALSGSHGRVRIPTPSSTDTSSTAKEVEKRLQAGYVPVPYSVLSGEQTTAWYRGPLIPAPPAAEVGGHVPFTSADEALIYLPKTGMFDISLAAAWTLGCQLVLSQRELAENMLVWKSIATSQVAAVALATHPETAGWTLNALPDTDDGPELDAELCARLRDRTRLRGDFHAAMLDGLGEQLTAAMQAPLPAVGVRKEEEKENEEAEVVPPPAPSIMLPEEAPQAPISLHQHALALLSDADTRHVLRTALAAEFAATSAAAPSAPAPQAYSTSDEEPASEEVSSNYDRRMWELDKMLALVPPWYLLPLADAVLPENSVRLFHIDTQWLSAFADGMLSIGTHTEVDSGCTPNLKSVLFQTYIEDPPIACGLLMRSPVLRHWPQDPFTTKEDELLFAAHGGANLVGRSQLGPDAVLLLFDKVPNEVTLREPAHVLQFGVTSGTPPEILLRNPSNGQMMQGKKVTVDGSLYRPALPGHSAEVLDIAQVANTLKEKLNLQHAVGAEHLALQLLHPPAVLNIKIR
ncbi:hypothetical protein [Streptomyces sp. NPDC001635]